MVTTALVRHRQKQGVLEQAGDVRLVISLGALHRRLGSKPRCTFAGGVSFAQQCMRDADISWHLSPKLHLHTNEHTMHGVLHAPDHTYHCLTHIPLLVGVVHGNMHRAVHKWAAQGSTMPCMHQHAACWVINARRSSSGSEHAIWHVCKLTTTACAALCTACKHALSQCT